MSDRINNNDILPAKTDISGNKGKIHQDYIKLDKTKTIDEDDHGNNQSRKRATLPSDKERSKTVTLCFLFESELCLRGPHLLILCGSLGGVC